VKAIYFVGEFLQLGNKKKIGESNKMVFEIKKKSPYLDQKKLELTIFK